MVRILIAAALCLGVLAAPAAAADPQDALAIDALARHYGAAELEQGRVEVTFVSSEVAWVRGTRLRSASARQAVGDEWLDVWERSAGEWTLVAELQIREKAPIRFGARRARGCTRTS